MQTQREHKTQLFLPLEQSTTNREERSWALSKITGNILKIILGIFICWTGIGLLILIPKSSRKWLFSDPINWLSNGDLLIKMTGTQSYPKITPDLLSTRPVTFPTASSSSELNLTATTSIIPIPSTSTAHTSSAAFTATSSRSEEVSPFLQKFINAQNGVGGYVKYSTALAEIRSGTKKTHWIWYIFPQLSGYGTSINSKKFGIKDDDEAVQYLKNSILRGRYCEITQVMCEKIKEGRTIPVIMGSHIDVQKLFSSMSLFENAATKLLTDPNCTYKEQLETLIANIEYIKFHAPALSHFF